MNKYEGPAFDVKENVASIWVAKGALADLPENYFQETDGEDDDEPFDPFSSDFGFGWYDYDFVETYCTDDWRMVPIAELIDPVSYSGSFRDAALRTAKDLGVERTSYIIILYNFRYDPEVTGIRESAYTRFLGVFPFLRQE